MASKKCYTITCKTDNATEGKPITCKAAVVWEFDKPISIETIEVEPPGFGEVRVKIVAVGLCHSDLTCLEGKALVQKLPYVPGHEGAGVVESIGEGVKGIKIGDKVLTLCIPHCRQCDVCKDRRTNVCKDIGRKEKVVGFLRQAGYDGTPRFSCKGQAVHMFAGCSSFSEYTVIPANSCVKIDAKAPLEKVCICACGIPTGYGGSTNSVQMKPGDTAVVWGVGGVGLAAVVGCKHKGAKKIIGVARSTNKEAIARKLGCTDFIAMNDLTKSVIETITEMTNGEGVDFVFNCTGDVKSMADGIAATKMGGTTVLMGVPESLDPLPVPPMLILLSRKIAGSAMGDYKVLDDVPVLVTKYLDKKLPVDDFITHQFKLEEINDAIDVMKSGKGIRSVILM